MNTTQVTICNKKASNRQGNLNKISLGNHGFDEIIKYNIDVPQVTDVLT